MDKLLLTFFVGFVLLKHGSTALSSKQTLTAELLRELLHNYDPRTQPPGLNDTDGPVKISVNIVLLDVHGFSELDMQYGATIYLKQEWVDKRLKYEKQEKVNHLTLTDTSKLWRADLFIVNEVEASFHDILKPNSFLRIYPSGKVLYSQRLTLHMSCPMNLKKFPFQEQYCSLRVASYAFTTENIILQWKDNNPIQMSGLIDRLNGFTIKHFITSNCIGQTSTGVYSCLQLKLVFQRKLFFFVMNIFLPGTLGAAVSWLSLWVYRGAWMARLLIILTGYSLSRAGADLEDVLPRTSYIKGVEVWIVGCYMFMLLVFLEFIAVVSQSQPDQKPSIVQDPNVFEASEVEKVADHHQSTELPPSKKDTYLTRVRRLLSRLVTDPDYIDTTARLAFPCLFIMFVIVYSIKYAL